MKKISYCLERVKNAERYKKINLIFLAAMLICAIISIVQILTSYALSGDIFNLRIFQRTVGIAFSDYFHTNDMVAENSPYYGDTSSYPPFVFMIARVFALFGDYTYGYEDMLSQPAAIAGLIIFYLIYFIASVLLIIYIMRSRGFNKLVTAAVCVIYIYNAPMIFNFERGNYIICALLFSLVFYAFYSSKNKVLRELSFVALAFAAGIKLYPALFAVVLLREKRICELLRCAAYSLLAIIISFMTFDGGLSNVARFLHWLREFSSELTDYGYNYSIASTIGIIASFFGIPIFSENSTLVAMQTYAPYALLILCAIASLLVNKKWKTYAIVSVAIIQFPTISFAYSLMFMLIPMLAYMEEKEKQKRDYIYMFLLFIILTPLYLGEALPEYGVGISQIITSLAIIALEFMLFAECFMRVIRAISGYRKRHAKEVIAAQN